MADIFSDLQKLGIGNVGNIFETEDNSKDKVKEQAKQQTPEELEAEMVFDKTHTCPLCDKAFTTKTVRAGKAKMIGSDTDLRAKYANIDVNKYDAIVCPVCGYAALARYFEMTTAPQRKLIKENISAGFKGIPASTSPIITYDEAMMNLKLALANAVVKKGKNSEKAYICLKMAWVIRGRLETPTEVAKFSKEEIIALKQEELAYIKQAYMGFTSAVQSETFPMCGMDEMTTIYLLADLARRSGDRAQALKLLGEVIVSKNAQGRLKEKARELKDLIMESK